MDKITFKQFKALLTSQPFFVWHDLQKDEREFDVENFWKQDLDYADTSASQVIMSTFSKITDKAKEDLINQGAIILSGDVEERIKQTKEAMQNKELVIAPIFEYNGALAKPFAFDFETNQLYEVKFSKKTKRMDFMKAYYQTEIIKKNYIKVSDYKFFIPVNNVGIKGVIDLTIVNTVSITKGGCAYNDTNKDGDLKSKPVIKTLKTQDSIQLKDIDLYVDEINNARDITKPVNSFEKDFTEFGVNPFWDDLLESFNNPWAGYNGKVIKKKKLIEGETPSGSVIKKLTSISGPEILDKNFVTKLMTPIQDAGRVVWYDFEGFSLPFPVMDNTKPYQQMVFQLSKIITNGEIKEESKDNLVWDPKLLNLDDLFEIIKEVYSDKADVYVVYNKGYENTRLKEMTRLLLNDPRYDEALTMVEHIDSNTIDLMELFKIGSENKLPPILMHDQKAKGSIKNIEKHISKNHYDIGYSIKEYKNLDIKNGGMAMQVAIERATGVMGDKEWNEKVKQLKVYCENDVKAMIMVYYYILFLQKK